MEQVWERGGEVGCRGKPSSVFKGLVHLAKLGDI